MMRPSISDVVHMLLQLIIQAGLGIAKRWLMPEPRIPDLDINIPLHSQLPLYIGPVNIAGVIPSSVGL